MESSDVLALLVAEISSRWALWDKARDEAIVANP